MKKSTGFILLALVLLIIIATGVSLMTILYIALALAILLVLITIHELGHYFAGKALKFKIKEFSIGFFKPLYQKVNKKTGEKFSIRLIPLGGYCAFEDDEPNPIEGNKPDTRPKKGERDYLTFGEQPCWKRIIVLASGGIFNIIFGFLAVLFMLMIVGYGTVAVRPGGVDTANIGILSEGDVITHIDGTKLSLFNNISSLIDGAIEDKTISVSFWLDENGKSTKTTAQFFKSADGKLELGMRAGLEDEIDSKGLGELFSLDLKRGNKERLENVQMQVAVHSVLEPGGTWKEVRVAKVVDWIDYDNAYFGRTTGHTIELTIKGRGIVPVNLSERLLNVTYADGTSGQITDVIFGLTKTHKYSFGDAIANMFSVSFDIFWNTLKAIFNLFTGQISVRNVSGPFGTIGAMAQVSRFNISFVFVLIPLISINLGVFNLMPLPALDGGRIFFVGIEAIRRKKINQNVEGMIHFIGIVLLLGFVLVIDFINLIL